MLTLAWEAEQRRNALKQTSDDALTCIPYEGVDATETHVPNVFVGEFSRKAFISTATAFPDQVEQSS